MRRGYEHWFGTGELLLEDSDPDFVWDMSTFALWPERQTYPGVEGARQFIADWDEAWETWEVEVEDHIDAGTGRHHRSPARTRQGHRGRR